jgi:DNA-binding transcriptional MerR regulator
MAQQQAARRKMHTSKTPVSIPDKLYFRIGDVARLCTLPAYVLRFWETEFPQLKPNKGGTGQRLYRKRDVEMVLEIKRLLYNEGFTIAGARRSLTEKRRLILSPVSKSEQPPVEEIRGTVKKSSKSGMVKTALSKPLSAQAKIPTQPKIKELREEMRELLTLLGSDPAERKPLPAPSRRDARKARQSDEPTLF